MKLDAAQRGSRYRGFFHAFQYLPSFRSAPLVWHLQDMQKISGSVLVLISHRGNQSTKSAKLSVLTAKLAMYFRVILPQVYRNFLLVIGNESILVLKDTALASTVTIMDMTRAARTYAPFEVFFIAGIVYLGPSLLLAQAFDRQSKHLFFSSHH